MDITHTILTILEHHYQYTDDLTLYSYIIDTLGLHAPVFAHCILDHIPPPSIPALLDIFPFASNSYDDGVQLFEHAFARTHLSQHQQIYAQYIRYLSDDYTTG